MTTMMMIDGEEKPVDVEGDAGDTKTKAATDSPAGSETPQDGLESPAEGSGDPAAGESASEEASPPQPPPSVPPRVVIVTGASSGLGLAVSKMLCAGKHDVIMACRNEQKATRAIAKIRKHQPDASATYMQVEYLPRRYLFTFY